MAPLQKVGCLRLLESCGGLLTIVSGATVYVCSRCLPGGKAAMVLVRISFLAKVGQLDVIEVLS